MNKLKHILICAVPALVGLLGAICICISVGQAKAADNKAVGKFVEVVGYDRDTDYMQLMLHCAEDGSAYALEMGGIYESCRNLKIDREELSMDKTAVFGKGKTAAEILAQLQPKKYTAEETDLLCRLVMAENGSSWIPDWVQQATAQVVLNRVESPNYPDTIRGVIYQAGQYGPAVNGSIHNTPSEKVKRNVQAALDGKSGVPSGVIGQSGFKQGKVWKEYHDAVLGATEYFCY